MEALSRVVTTFVLDFLWQVLLIAVMAWGCACLIRRASAKLQHLLWVTALGFSLVVPLISAARHPLMPAPFGVQRRGTAIAPRFASPVPRPSPQAQLNTSTTAPARREAAQVSSSHSPRLLRGGQYPVPLATSLTLIVASGYLLYILYRTVRFFVGYRRAARIDREAVPLALSGVFKSAAEDCFKVFGLGSIPILGSRTVHSPITLRVRRPMIVLPERLVELDDRGVIASIIAHELAHIRRRDYALNLVYELLYLPISFHPAASLIVRRIAETRELACDELVTDCSISASEYARALISAAVICVSTGRRTHVLGAYGADNLEERIARLTTPQGRSRGWVTSFKLGLASVLMLITAAVLSGYTLSASKPGRSPVDGGVGKLAVWIGYPGARYALLECEGGSQAALLPRATLRPKGPPRPGGPTALDLHVGGGAERITVNVRAVYNDISDPHWWMNKKEEPVGSYDLGDGDKVEISELSRFGLDPILVKARKDRPEEVLIGSQIRIEYRVSHLAVTSVRKTLGWYHLTLNNEYGQPIRQWYLSFGSQAQSEQYLPPSRMIPPGITQDAIRLATRSVGGRTIVIDAVELADGTIDGEPEIAMRFLGEREGQRLQAPRVMDLINEARAKPDADIFETLRALEAELWALPEPNRETAVSALKARFASLGPARDPDPGIKGGIYEARNWALMEVGDFERRQNENGDCRSDSCRSVATGFLRNLESQYTERIANLNSLQDVFIGR